MGAKGNLSDLIYDVVFLSLTWQKCQTGRNYQLTAPWLPFYPWERQSWLPFSLSLLTLLIKSTLSLTLWFSCSILDKMKSLTKVPRLPSSFIARSPEPVDSTCYVVWQLKIAVPGCSLKPIKSICLLLSHETQPRFFCQRGSNSTVVVLSWVL